MQQEKARKFAKRVVTYSFLALVIWSTWLYGRSWVIMSYCKNSSLKEFQSYKRNSLMLSQQINPDELLINCLERLHYPLGKNEIKANR